MSLKRSGVSLPGAELPHITERAVAEVALALLAWGGVSPLVGTIPQSLRTVRWKWCGGSPSVNASGGGNVDVTFKEAFPAGLLCVVAMSDTAITLNVANTTLAKFRVVRADGLNNATRMSYLAVGW